MAVVRVTHTYGTGGGVQEYADALAHVDPETKMVFIMCGGHVVAEFLAERVISWEIIEEQPQGGRARGT